MSKIAIVLSGADFSTLGLGQVTLNLGTKYSVTYPSDKHYSVSPTNVYGDSSATIRVIPNSGYTFVSADATSTPSAPTITMGGISVPCSLEGEYYVARISSVSGNIVVSGGSATTKAPTYTIALNLTNITASLSNGGSAINSVDVKQGGSKVVYLSTTGNYILPSSFSNTGTNCTINFTRTSDTQGTITITASGNGSITASGIETIVPTWQMSPKEQTFDTTFKNTSVIDTNIKPNSANSQLTILTKFKPTTIDKSNDYLTDSYIFGTSTEANGVRITSNKVDDNYAYLSFWGVQVGFVPEIAEYAVYVAMTGNDNKLKYVIKNLDDDSKTIEGELIGTTYTSSSATSTIYVGGASYSRGANTLGCKATIHDVQIYDNTYLEPTNSQVQSFLNN